MSFLQKIKENGVFKKTDSFVTTLIVEIIIYTVSFILLAIFGIFSFPTVLITIFIISLLAKFVFKFNFKFILITSILAIILGSIILALIIH